MVRQGIKEVSRLESLKVTVLVYRNNVLESEWLKQNKFISHNSRGWKSEIGVPGWLGLACQ